MSAEGIRPLLCEYVSHGLYLVELRAADKRPVHQGWNTREVCERTTRSDDFATRVAAGKASVGLALAYSGRVAVDVDDIEKARKWFADHGIDLDALINAPDTVRRESGRQNRTLLLYRVSAPLRSRRVPTAGIEFLSATSQGLTMQIAVPPSVNPKSLQRYEWKGDWRQPPELPDDLRRAWESAGAADVDPERKATPPNEKGGIVGAICRAYDPREGFPHSALPAPVYEAMCENFAPGSGDRYAYLKAASGRTDGLKVLEDGAIQIFDATFPGEGAGSMNVFDVMRLALYGSDSTEDLARPMQDRPSYRKLVEALRDEQRVRQHWQQADVEFENLDEAEGSQSSAETPKPEAAAKGRQPYQFEALPDDILTCDFPDRDYAIYPYVPKGTVAYLSSVGGFGKSYASLLLAICKALGLPYFCGRPCTPGSVVVLSAEDDMGEMKRRAQRVLRHLQAQGAVIDKALLKANLRLVDLTGKVLQNMLVCAQQHGAIPTDLADHIAQQIGTADLTIVDTQSRFNGASENDNTAGAVFVSACERIASKTGAGILVLSHTGKAVAREGIVDQYVGRGASSYSDNARSVMVLACLTEKQLKQYEFDSEEVERADVFRLAHLKHSYGKKADDVFLRRQDDGVVAPFHPASRYIMTEEDRTWQLIGYFRKSEATPQLVKEKFKSIFGASVTRDRAEEIFKAAIDDGLFEFLREYRRTKSYKVSERALKELATRPAVGQSMDDAAFRAEETVAAAAASPKTSPVPTAETTPTPKARKTAQPSDPQKPARLDLAPTPVAAAPDPTPTAAPGPQPAAVKSNAASNGHDPKAWQKGPNGKPLPLIKRELRYDAAVRAPVTPEALMHLGIDVAMTMPRGKETSFFVFLPADANLFNALKAAIDTEIDRRVARRNEHVS